MKRTRWAVLTALLVGASVATWMAVPVWPNASSNDPAHLLGTLARTGRVVLNAAFGAATPAALAQETLEFKEVPPESVPSPRDHRRTRTTITLPPAPPRIDVDVDAPKVIIGQSGDIMKIGSDIVVEENQVVSGDVLAVGANVEVHGHVEGNVVSMGGNVELTETARVDGDVVCMGGRLTEEPGSFIGGQRVTTGGFHGWPNIVRVQRHNNVGAGIGSLIGWMMWLLILLALAWAFTRLAPGSTGSALDMLQTRTALSFGIGLLVWALLIPSLIAVVLVVAFLCITIIGIPLALALLFGYFLFVALLTAWGYVVGMAAIGDMLLRRMAPAPLAAPAPMAPPPAGEAPAAGVAAPALPAPAHVEHSLTRKAIVGVLVVGGLEFAGRFLKVFDFVPGLHAIGGLFDFVGTMTCMIATTFGVGAWLRAEFVSGTLGRWWSGRRQFRPMRSSTPAPDTGTATPPPAPPPPPPSQG